jgi:hypothetical protein
MARVTESDVRAIITTSVVSLDVFIAQAALVVDEQLDGLGMTDARLKEIERFLAAHFIASSIDPQAKSESVGAVSATYEGQQGLGLQSTRYGQQAIAFDTTGTLKTQNTAGVSAAFLFEAF